jgi:hypothetical protein
MKTYTFYWNNGKKDILEGIDVAEALIKAGYSAMILDRLSFYFPGDNDDFTWDEKSRRWIFVPSEKNHQHN